MLSARSPALHVETEGIFSSWKESECSPATPFVLMFSWLGATERLSTKHSLEPVLRWGFTQIPQFWMTAFTPSAGGMRHTHIYAHSAKIPCQGSSDNQILWASSVSPGSLLLSDCLLMLSTLLHLLSLPSASLQNLFFLLLFFHTEAFLGIFNNAAAIPHRVICVLIRRVRARVHECA